LTAVARRRGYLLVNVRVQPRSSRDVVESVRDGRLQIRTTAPPVDGKANRAAIRLLADYLQVPPSRISQTRGMTHRNKQFRVEEPVSLPNGL
jgi:uncharacterized protein (TIGR00251 family)